jgi:hypothetical protein
MLNASLVQTSTTRKQTATKRPFAPAHLDVACIWINLHASHSSKTDLFYNKLSSITHGQQANFLSQRNWTRLLWTWRRRTALWRCQAVSTVLLTPVPRTITSSYHRITQERAVAKSQTSRHWALRGVMNVLRPGRLTQQALLIPRL